MCKALGLVKVWSDKQLVMFSEEQSCLNSQRIDRPGAQEAAQMTDDVGCGGKIAQSQTWHGIGLGHRVHLNDVALVDSIQRCQHRLISVILVGLVDDQQFMVAHQ